jgi:transcription-repair coupling factor (superfamily II helicase)
MLSSFKTGAEQKKILRRLEEKKIDIVIGTHRLLQGDMKFSDLGLVIIDEEQRFGVEHKNNFKKLRTTVDVLTMTATPIPRTLYMAVTGARDLSTIMTAPGQRLPVQTAVAPFNNEIISSAVRAEIGRGGQVFFVHNRVKTIEKTAEFLQKLIPEASFATAHGQMREHKLENIMTEFIKGEIDVLVCTTIIESGLDIPNANTMLIERADRFGLAELYQLRGRIGRWSKQAYAYMLLPPEGLPAGDARKRIAAIRRYTHLGAGFKLALRDLEIRGAGNLLGAEQSGHINAVGFELYCNLLRNAVTRMKGGKIEFIPKTEMNLDFVEYGHRAAGTTAVAGFPPEYINCPRLRIEAYRKLNSITSFEDINKLEEELTDRYGSLPKQARYLICIATARLSAAKASISSVTTIGGKIIIKRGTRIMRVEGKIPLFPEKLTCYDKIKFLVNFFKNFTPE